MIKRKLETLEIIICTFVTVMDDKQWGANGVSSFRHSNMMKQLAYDHRLIDI